MIKTYFRCSAFNLGVSLMEMLISLAIFAVIAIPMMMLPIQAVDMSTEARNTGSLNYEMSEFFGDFQRSVNMSYAFMDISQIAANDSDLGLDPLRQVFLAYWDPQQNRVIRKGYQLRSISGFSDRWQIMEADIRSTDQISDFSVNNNSVWRVKTKTLQGNNFYLQGNPRFVYCRAGNCGTDANGSPITALNADGIRIQEGNAPVISGLPGGPFPASPIITAGVSNGNIQAWTPLRFVYRNIQYSTPPKYFRLATLQQDLSRRLSDKQVLPFAMALREWSTNNTLGPSETAATIRLRQHWIAERQLTLSNSRTVRIPIQTAADLAGTFVDLPMNDLHYNAADESLVVATSSATSVNDSERGAYVFKFRPGMIDYRAFTMNLANGDTYTDPFPIVIHQGDPAWPNTWTNLEFLGATQDLLDNTYVLARTLVGSGQFTYWVEKFSPTGVYMSRFPLDTTVSASDGSALGITFNPALPDEVQVLVRQTSTGNFYIYSYPSSQNTDLAENVAVANRSPNLNTISLGSGLAWGNVRGLEYDPLNNRYIFVFVGAGTTTTGFAQVASLDADLGGGAAARARLMLQVYPPNNTTPLSNPVGIAYNSSNNLVYLPTFTGGIANPSRYYAVVCDVPLGVPR